METDLVSDISLGLLGHRQSDGIMSAVDSSERTRTGDMQDALRDLEALMTKAKHMVSACSTQLSDLAERATDRPTMTSL